MNAAIPRSVWQGTFRVFGVDVKCHVLEDGRRIIEAESLEKLFGARDDLAAAIDDNADMEAFACWQRGEAV